MQNKIEIINKKNSVEINIEGTIGVPEEWQFDEPQERIATYDKFRNAVDLIRQVNAPEIIVNIRSTGGDVNDALLMHDAISSLKGTKITRCYGYTASAATIIAQAASAGYREISANALYLIHRAICAVEGSTEELAAKMDLLQKTDERIAAIYSTRSNRPADEFTVLMAENSGNGRWLSPDEAVAAGLADRIVTMSEVLNCTVINDNPIHNYMVKIKNKYKGILRNLGLTPEGVSEVEISDEQIATLNQSIEDAETQRQELHTQLEAEQTAHQQTRDDLTGVQNNIKTLEAELAKLKAEPTVVKKVEDPAITNAGKTEGNARSYADDATKFKK